jgi:hypothetical protein
LRRRAAGDEIRGALGRFVDLIWAMFFGRIQRRLRIIETRLSPGGYVFSGLAAFRRRQ